MMRRLLLVILFALWCAPAFAIGPDEVLADPALEARARVISKQLRCLVCQSESIDDSEADLAKDLRRLVRERLLAGDSDKQVIDYIAARYGDFVRMTPPVKPETLPLWWGPVIALALAGGIVVLSFSKRRAPAVTPLSADEEARLEQTLKRLSEGD